MKIKIWQLLALIVFIFLVVYLFEYKVIFLRYLFEDCYCNCLK